MQRITLIGNLTRDPETRATPNGVTVCSFTVAVSRKYAPEGKDKITDYFRVNVWRQLGDICARYLSKGKKSGSQRRAAGPYLYGQGRYYKAVSGCAGRRDRVLVPEWERRNRKGRGKQGPGKLARYVV